MKIGLANAFADDEKVKVVRCPDEGEYFEVWDIVRDNTLFYCKNPDCERYSCLICRDSCEYENMLAFHKTVCPQQRKWRNEFEKLIEECMVGQCPAKVTRPDGTQGLSSPA